MKILYLRTVPWYNLKSGGSVGHTSGVINAMDRDHEIQVVSNDHLAGVSIPIEVVPSPFKALPILNEVLFNWKLMRRFSKDKLSADILYQRHSLASISGAYISKKTGVPLVLEFNSSEVWKLSNWGKKRNKIASLVILAYRKWVKLPLAVYVERYNLKQATTIVVVSKVLESILIEMGVDRSKILVNPNGVDIETYEPTTIRNPLHHEYTLEGKQVVGFIGTFGQWHGGIVLAEAINQFYKRFPEKKSSTVFLLIGDGNQLPEVRKIIDSSLQKSHVIFAGRTTQSKGLQHLQLCDIFLSPHVPNPDGTEFFGSPTKLFEYMALGKPIIASALNQIADILQHEYTGLLVEPGNPNSLATAIAHLLDHPELQKTLGKNARNTAMESYSWHSHVDHILRRVSANNDILD